MIDTTFPAITLLVASGAVSASLTLALPPANAHAWAVSLLQPLVVMTPSARDLPNSPIYLVVATPNEQARLSAVAQECPRALLTHLAMAKARLSLLLAVSQSRVNVVAPAFKPELALSTMGVRPPIIACAVSAPQVSLVFVSLHVPMWHVIEA